MRAVFYTNNNPSMRKQDDNALTTGRDPDTYLENFLPTAESQLETIWESESLLTDDTLSPSILSPTLPSVSRLPTGKDRLLGHLVQRKSTYKAMLALILGGATVKDALGSLGIPQGMAWRWLNLGNAHFHSGKDSWYSRLWNDCYRTKSQARAVAQARIREKRPLDWMRNDADRRGWSESPASLPQHEDLLDMEPALEEDDVASLTHQQVLDAFQVLKDNNILPDQQVLIREALAQAGIADVSPSPAPDSPPAD
jgi:hypothetical protein